MVTVVSESGLPVFVQNGNEMLSVSKGNAPNFYWISQAGTDSNEENIINKVNQVAEQGVSMIVESGEKSSKKRFLAVRIEKMIFAMEIKN